MANIQEEENEFEKQYNTSQFTDEENNAYDSKPDVNTKATSDNKKIDNDYGEEFDFNKASKSTKGPERINMNGMETEIIDVKIILPKLSSDWEMSKQKTTKYKGCQFVLFYGESGQREYYSGVRIFPRVENGIEKHSEPVIQNNSKTQASILKSVYAKFKDKKPEEVSMFEFLSFLKSKPKVKLSVVEVEYNDEITKKNMVSAFLR